MTDILTDRERILDAMERRVTLAILYHGGSNPGAYREILPLQVTSGGSLRARCLTSKATKFFKFESIELTELKPPAPAPEG